MGKAASAIYTLQPEDVEIFKRARTDGGVFTSFYFRDPITDERGWRFDHNIDPPWQLDMHHAKQTTIVIVGGMGSSKTSACAMSAITWATMLPDFKVLVVAPTSNQAYQMFDFLRTAMSGTLFEERFQFRQPAEKPYPKIFIRYKLPNGKVVSSIIEFMSAADDAVRIKNYEGDMVILDQAEMMDNLSESISFLGTRVRGNVKGRSRLGRLVLIANADDNPDLWYQFEMGEDYPDEYLAVLVTTYSNKNLTKEQIRDFERRMGNDPDKIAQHMNAKRPMGAGKEFKRALMEGVIDLGLDAVMTAAQEADNFEYEVSSSKRAGIIHWKMPYEPGHLYVVVGDPGQGRAPERNAPVVFVVDVTEYPTGSAPLRAFWWGDGGGKYEPFVEQMKLWMHEFRAAAGAYDSTGGQKIHSEMSFLDNPNIHPIDLSGIKKKMHMATLKVLFARKKVRMPGAIKGMNSQFAKYELPDDKLAQDLVSTWFIFAGLLWALGIDQEILAEAEPSEAVIVLPVMSRDSRLVVRDGGRLSR